MAISVLSASTTGIVYYYMPSSKDKGDKVETETTESVNSEVRTGSSNTVVTQTAVKREPPNPIKKIPPKKNSRSLEDSEIEELNNLLEEQGIPKECRFKKEEKKNPIECDVDEEGLKNINFEFEYESKDETFTVEGEVKDLKLMVKAIGEAHKTAYYLEKNLILNFFNFENNIVLKAPRNQNTHLTKGTIPEFIIFKRETAEEEKFVVNKTWSKMDILGHKVGLECMEENCTPYSSDELISSSGAFTVKKSDRKKKIKLYNNQENYNQGFKFVVTEEINGTKGEKLEVGNYEILYSWETDTNSIKWYLSKKD